MKLEIGGDRYDVISMSKNETHQETRGSFGRTTYGLASKTASHFFCYCWGVGVGVTLIGSSAILRFLYEIQEGNP